MELDPEIE